MLNTLVYNPRFYEGSQWALFVATLGNTEVKRQEQPRLQHVHGAQAWVQCAWASHRVR